MIPCFYLCISCNQKIRDAIFNDSFGGTLIKVLLPLLLLMPMILIYKKSLNQTSKELKSTPVVVSSMMIGIGMGGFLDGIIFHQLLQFHQMLSGQVSNLSYEGKTINMFWDGIFESVTWIFTITGLILMWHSFQRQDILKGRHEIRRWTNLRLGKF